jgi:hypothetical protein
MPILQPVFTGCEMATYSIFMQAAHQFVVTPQMAW